jgi:hypothetical protein
MPPRDPISLDDRTDLAELLELLNTFAQDDGAPDPVQATDTAQAPDPVQATDTAHSTNPVQAADTVQATNPVHEEHRQALPEDNERQTEPDDPLDVEQNAARQPASLYDSDRNNRFAAHIIQGMAKMRARLRDEG